MEYKKNIKDIYNVDIKGGDMHTIFVRVSETHFSQSFKMDDPSYEICDKCGEWLNSSNHNECEYSIVDELYVAQEIINMLQDDEENVVEINNDTYISLKSY